MNAMAPMRNRLTLLKITNAGRTPRGASRVLVEFRVAEAHFLGQRAQIIADGRPHELDIPWWAVSTFSAFQSLIWKKHGVLLHHPSERGSGAKPRRTWSHELCQAIERGWTVEDSSTETRIGKETTR